MEEKEEYTKPNTESPIHDTKLNTNLPVKKYEIDYTGVGLFAGMFLVIATLLFTLTNGESEQLTLLPVPEEEIVEEIEEIDYFANVDIEGTAAFVWDAEQGESLYSLNEETQLPLASITKLMTVAVASKYLADDDTILIQDGNLYEEGDSGLLAFEEWVTRDLIDFTLIVSSNDGADVLASAAGAAKIVRSGSQDESPEEVFISEMNTLAEEIGLTQTYFINETGLDPTEAVSGGYGSAKDAALLMNHLVNTSPELVEATTNPKKEIYSLSNFKHTATNTNQNVGNIPGLIASKTGFTDLAGGNLVVAFDAGINRPIIVSVLGSSVEGRFTDVETLVAAALRQINQ